MMYLVIVYLTYRGKEKTNTPALFCASGGSDNPNALPPLLCRYSGTCKHSAVLTHILLLKG